jgi:hypothetical protein
MSADDVVCSSQGLNELSCFNEVLTGPGKKGLNKKPVLWL